MPKPKIEVYFFQGYSGAPKCEARIAGVEHVVELEQVTELITRAMKEKGYKVEKSARQKYPRVIINK